MRDSSVLAIVLTGQPKSGRRLFDALIEANSACFWNGAVFSAVAALQYAGFVRPSTLFVTASPVYLDAIRSAYAKRMLKAPPGTAIRSLGDMGALRPVQQLHFVPLSDAFCDAVAHLNRCGRPATIASVKEHIARQCQEVAPPSDEMLHQTTVALVREGVVHRAGHHLFLAPAPAKTTVECQTGDSILVEQPLVSAAPRPPKTSILARLFSRGAKNNRRESAPAPILAPSTKQNINQQETQQQITEWDYAESIAIDNITKTTQQQRKHHIQALRPCIDSEQFRRCRRPKEQKNPKQKAGRSDADTRGGGAAAIENIYTAAGGHAQRRPRASTPIDSSAAVTTTGSGDSAYSASSSSSLASHSDESGDDRGGRGGPGAHRARRADHTYVNLAKLRGGLHQPLSDDDDDDETCFEECTLSSPKHHDQLLLTNL